MSGKAPATWLVERNYLGHDEGWWIDSGYSTKASAQAHVRQLRASVAKRGYRLRVREDV